RAPSAPCGGESEASAKFREGPSTPAAPPPSRIFPMTSMNRIAAVTAALLMLAGVMGFLSLTGFISGSENQDSQRSAPVQSAADRAVFQLQQRLASEPHDLAAVDGLGSAYLRNARESSAPPMSATEERTVDKATVTARKRERAC